MLNIIIFWNHSYVFLLTRYSPGWGRCICLTFLLTIYRLRIFWLEVACSLCVFIWLMRCRTISVHGVIVVDGKLAGFRIVYCVAKTVLLTLEMLSRMKKVGWMDNLLAFASNKIVSDQIRKPPRVYRLHRLVFAMGRSKLTMRLRAFLSLLAWYFDQTKN